MDVFPFIFVHRNYLEFSGLDRETDTGRMDEWFTRRWDDWLIEWQRMEVCEKKLLPRFEME